MVVSNSEIIKIAKKYKKYVRKYRKVPKKITIGDKTYTKYQCAYLFSLFVNNPTADQKVFKIKAASYPRGDEVLNRISKASYQDAAKRISDYIVKEKQLPNFVTIDGKKVDITLYAFDLSKIVVYYGKHKKLPKNCLINSKAIKAKASASSSSPKEFLRSSGCSGMGQCTGYYCACNSLQQAFYFLTGIKVDESTIASVAGTTTSGTDHYGINTAVAWFNNKYNKKVKIEWFNFSDLGKNDKERWNKLAELSKTCAIFCHLLYRLKWGHYEPIGKINEHNLEILNSLGSICSYPAYCGYVEPRSKAEQLSYMRGISQKSIAVLSI